jgi:hypothetical protein
MARRDPKKQYDREAGTGMGLQPDPLLHEGRSSRLWIGTAIVVVAGVIVVTFFAIGGDHQKVAQQQPQHGPPITTGSGSPQPALPPGRTNADVPLNAQSTKVR